MILLGSQAAIIRGCLPTWREGRAIDFDMHGTLEEVDAIEVFLRKQGHSPIRAEKGYGVGMFVRDVAIVDFHFWRPSDDLIMALPDNISHTVMGMDMVVISEVTQLIIKESYISYKINFEKNERDILFWRSKLGDFEISSEHSALKSALEKQMKELFGNRKKSD